MAEKKKKKTFSKTLWVAVDNISKAAIFFKEKPSRDLWGQFWKGHASFYSLEGFQNLTWEDEPLKVNVTFNIE